MLALARAERLARLQGEAVQFGQSSSGRTLFVVIDGQRVHNLSRVLVRLGAKGWNVDTLSRFVRKPKPRTTTRPRSPRACLQPRRMPPAW